MLKKLADMIKLIFAKNIFGQQICETNQLMPPNFSALMNYFSKLELQFENYCST